MNPYYSDEFVSVMHGDNREWLPRVLEPCAVVTDQPYGTGWVRGGGRVGEFVVDRSAAAGQSEHPEWDRWDMSWVSLVPTMKAFAVFGPWSRRDDLRASLPQPNVNVWWHKTNPRPNGPALEPICVGPAYLPDGVEFHAYNGDTPLHPNQKPLALMLWVLRFIPPDLLIVDPFAGSGTTGVAAKLLGRRAALIEGQETHCRTIASRLSQSVLDLGGAA